MSQHLTPQQIAEWIGGERTADAQEHLQECARCAAEVDRFNESLALTRSAVRGYCQQVQPELWPAAPLQRRRPLEGAFRWRLAMATAALLTIAAIPIVRYMKPAPPAEPQASVSHLSDDALLRRVESDLSRSVPTPIEPLAKLMSEERSAQ